MGYLTSYRGDYLSSYRGDPGFFSFIGKALKGGLGVVSKLGIPVVSGVAGIASGVLGRKRPQVQRMPPGAIMQGQRFPGGRALQLPQAGRPLPRSISGLAGLTPPGTFGTRRRRMNPANPKALRRAIRRQASFVKLARRALKGSGYAITSRGSSRRPRTVNIRESGPGGVSVGR